MDVVATWVFVGIFALVSVLGFVAGKWRAADLNHLDEWGLGGRAFGTIVTWFLLGGDLYTAYTFIAIPALVYGKGAIGFFALPYTIIAFTGCFMVFPKFLAVSRKHGFVTASDYIRARFDSPTLALLVALTGILAIMPYIALQLVGIEVVIGALGFHGHLPLVIAFVILAAYTYTSGLRAPALIAVVKDFLIYIVVFAALIYIPYRLGGYGKMMSMVPPEKLTLAPGQGFAYATLALGSALALFLYPHSVTALLSASGARVVKRNMALLPAYSILLCLISALGYMAIVSGVGTNPAYADGFRRYGPNFSVPALFLHWFPSWFSGLAFGTIAIGALVPAAIMSIAASNLFTRNIYKEYLRPNCTLKQETDVAKAVSLVVKFGALLFILYLPQEYAVQTQLLGGIWIIQTLPAVILSLYFPWLRSGALIAGLIAGLAAGTWMAASQNFVSTFPLELGSTKLVGYSALYALIINLGVSGIGSAIAHLAGARHNDLIHADDYTVLD
jgi:SSS family solute:Na+ symporter